MKANHLFEEERYAAPFIAYFSGSSNPKLAADIAGRLGVELGRIKLTRFKSGEIYVHYEESIRNCDVFGAITLPSHQ